MPRPPHPRRIDQGLDTLGFRPIGRPGWDLPRVTLPLDGLEALRLADLEGLYQEAAAERMGVSRATFARILARARAVVAEALVGGKILLIESHVPAVPSAGGPIPCPVHWGGRRRGRGCRCRAGGPWLDDAGDETDAGAQAPEGGSDAGV